MIHFISENMAPLMFGGLIVFLIIGYPAAFSLAAVGLFFGFIGVELGHIRPDFSAISRTSSTAYLERPAARDSVLYFDGRDSGTLRAG